MKRIFSLVVLGIFLVVLMTGRGVSKPIQHKAKADFNNDGYDDIITVETRLKSDYHLVTIAFGTEKKNSFKKPVKVLKIYRDIFKDITGIKCGDYNSDGNIDLTLKSTTHLDSARRAAVSVYLYISGYGDGTFKEERSVDIEVIPQKKKKK